MIKSNVPESFILNDMRKKEDIKTYNAQVSALANEPKSVIEDIYDCIEHETELKGFNAEQNYLDKNRNYIEVATTVMDQYDSAVNEFVLKDFSNIINNLERLRSSRLRLLNIRELENKLELLSYLKKIQPRPISGFHWNYSEADNKIYMIIENGKQLPGPSKAGMESE
ncbi:MAG: hypothetical protein KJ697_01090 [Nanoarchaeota archaeon]|nr:hypothetical protein [Nanoarchaeota archaeon]